MRFYVFALAIFVFTQNVWALPEAIRHSYVNCNSCHFSPTGGGALTAYGRALSQELFATFKTSEKPFHGMLPDSLEKLSDEDRLVLAGFLRTLQFYKVTSAYTEARFIPMQADLELGYSNTNFAFIGTIGQQSVNNGLKRTTRTFSRRHYALLRVNESHQLRLGRFARPFGLQDPNHTLYTRKDLNFGFDSETYNLEYAYLFPEGNIFINYSLGNFENRYAKTDEKGLAVSGSHIIGEKSKMGGSFFAGKDSLMERFAVGPFGVISYCDIFFSTFEADLQWSRARLVASTATGAYTRGHALSHKLNVEIYSGVIPFILTQQSLGNWDLPTTQKEMFGLGLQWFVIPHLELQGVAQREFLYTQGRPTSDLFYLTMHWYL